VSLAVKVTSSKTDRGGFMHIRVEKPTRFVHTSGQYVTFQGEHDDKPKYLAIASHTNEADLLFVFRGTLNGDTVQISQPMGTGFRVDFSDPRPMLFLTHGTGISAVRPAIIERHLAKLQGDVLVYGIADSASEPELDVLTDASLTQMRAFSKTESPKRVQMLLTELDTSNFGAIIMVGSKEMMADNRTLLMRKQFAAEKIISNY